MKPTDPLPPPRKGHFEVDPWSLPPPDGGYESLVLEEGGGDEREGAPGTAPAAARPGPTSAAPAPARSRARLAAGAAAAALALGAAVWLAAGRPTAPAREGAAVRATVTQELPWTSQPPLAPPDPSYVERPRAPGARAPSAAGGAAAAAPLAPPATAPAAPPPPDAAARLPAHGEPDAAAARDLPAAPATATAPEASPPPAPEPVPAAADAPPPSPPALAAAAPAQDLRPGSRARAPLLRTPGCVAEALRVPRTLEGRLPREVVVRLEVGVDGRPSDVAFAGSVDPRLGSALAAAIRTCRFEPGADPNGAPAPAPATMRVRLEP